MTSLPVAIGKYRVIARLGQGGMARVLLCMTRGVGDFHKLMVVKQLREELAAEPEFVTLFLDEARIAARLNHPNVVQTYEVGEEDGEYFIAMDYLEGQPLNRILRRVGRDAMPLDIHLSILSETLSGLHYAHELKDYNGSPLSMVHRDVSPENVFVTYEGQVKLVDFGIAKAAGATHRTKTGQFKGKVNYIAPEQAQSEEVDCRADIFSVGVMLWEALAKQRLAKGMTAVMALTRRISGQEPSAREVAPESPPELLDICERALALELDARYPSADVIRDDLDAYLDKTDRRITKKELAAFMNEHFAEDRAKMQVTIDEQINLHGEAESGEFRPIVTLAGGPPSLTSLNEDGDPSEPSNSMNTPSGIQEATAVTRVQGKTSSTTFALIATAAVAIAVGGYAATSSEPVAEQTPLSGPALHESQFKPKPGAPAGSATSDPEAPAITVRVAATPADATITIDGASTPSNPFKTRAPVDETMHRIQVSAKGYRTVERIVMFAKDVDLVVALEKENDPPTKAKGPAAPVVPPPVAPPPVEPATQPPPSVLPRKPPPSRPIDEKDPYK